MSAGQKLVLVGYYGLCIAALAFALSLSLDSPAVAFAVVCLPLALLLTALNPAGAAAALMLTASLAAPLIALRVGGLTVGDIALVAAAGLAAITTHRRPSPQDSSTRAILAVVALMTVGGAFATMAVSYEPDASTATLLQYAGAATLSIGGLWLLRPARSEVVRFVGAFGAGAVVSSIVGAVTEIPDYLRPSGLALHPNHLGISAALGFAALLAVGLEVAGWRRWLAFAGAGVSIYGVLLSGSRAGLVAAAIALAAVLLGVGARRAARLAAILITLGAVAVLVGWVRLDENSALSRLLGGGTADAADDGRAVKYARILDRALEHPLLGSGFAEIIDGHSLYLQMWTAAGLLGAVAAAVLVAACVRAYLRARTQRDLFSVGLWAGQLGFLVAAAVSNQMFDRYLWLFLALALASEWSRPQVCVPTTVPSVSDAGAPFLMRSRLDPSTHRR